MMKSKVEILKAVDTCTHVSGRCIDCPYCDDTAYCVDHLVADLREALIKSDFEVMKEILGRSEGIQVNYYTDMTNNIVVRIPLDAYIRFNSEGGIL